MRKCVLMFAAFLIVLIIAVATNGKSNNSLDSDVAMENTETNMILDKK
ncbi:hypothetical protein GGR42_002121 [Saonia flava]|uniref:Uncharacterized protein n=1 Tax=Saonia flava TaxID=523696 RepID=A0A846R4C7_9FLAO|nr:hypothetical protein [Saonia flava]NJB71659.1 hypothetical protein [Saonia flava]